MRDFVAASGSDVADEGIHPDPVAVVREWEIRMLNTFRACGLDRVPLDPADPLARNLLDGFSAIGSMRKNMMQPLYAPQQVYTVVNHPHYGIGLKSVAGWKAVVEASSHMGTVEVVHRGETKQFEPGTLPETCPWSP